MPKKSQITIFLILGFVILISFSLLIVLKQQATTKKLDKEVTTVAADELKIQEIKSYIQSCIDSEFSEALELITKQGGYIFDYQNGSLLDKKIPYAEFQGTNISYQIFRPKFSPDDTLAAPSLYPCHATDPLCQMGWQLGDPGRYCCNGPPDPEICIWSGDYCRYRYNHTQAHSNHFVLGYKGKLRLCTYDYNIGAYSCKCPSEPCTYSMQAQIGYYVKSQLPTCLNFSMFTGFNITTGNITTNVTIGSDDVSLDLKMPVTIKLKDYAPTKKELDFKSKQSVRLLQIYSLIFGMGSNKGLIDYETDNFTYNIVKEGQELANKFGYFKIEKLDHPAEKASIIIINDTSDSKLNGKNVVFQFAVENRNPALDYTSFNLLGAYDVFVFKGKEIIFRPDAYDPDDDALRYRYYGWKTGSSGPDNLPFDLAPGENVWESSVFYSDKINCIVNAEKGMQDNVCANNVTTDEDVGEHYVTIEVTDSNGYKDWQKIRIYVSDILTPEIKSGHEGCRKKGGDYIEYFARKDFAYILEGFCGASPNPPYRFTFIWTFDPDVNPDPPYGASFPVTLPENTCTNTINPIFSSTGPYTIGLTVENTLTLVRTSATSKTVFVYPDEDDDGFCDNPSLDENHDCNDNKITGYSINPDATEFCDGIDNDCDSLIDEGCDYDGDGYIAIAQGGDDCDDTVFAINPGVAEDCDDGIDNNCNGDVDCDDSTCILTPVCCLITESPEISCSDSEDNDCDGNTDMWDPDCSIVCTGPLNESNRFVLGQPDCDQCNYAGDQDADQSYWPLAIADQCDSDCGTVTTTVKSSDYQIAETRCSDGIDNDCDSFIDEWDSNCNIVCTNTNENNWFVIGQPDCDQCDYNADQDNDQGGWSSSIADQCDSDCGTVTTTVKSSDYQIAETRCTDLIDNDCDSFIDEWDPDCSSICANTNEKNWFVLGQSDCNQCDYTGDQDGDQSYWPLAIADQCDSDCNPSLSLTVKQADYDGATESRCGDSKDNDCDGNKDCADPNCISLPVCCPLTMSPYEPSGEVHCADGKDNDCDGKVDCTDPNCIPRIVCCPLTVSPYEPPPPVGVGEISCADGKDNDCDGFPDGSDSDCSGECNNWGEDDWLVDGQPDCNQCDYNADQDGDQGGWSSSIADQCDSDCGIVPITVELGDYEAVETRCDGLDNDCDGITDPFGGPEICDNLFDDDCDGNADCQDDNCFGEPGCP